MIVWKPKLEAAPPLAGTQEMPKLDLPLILSIQHQFAFLRILHKLGKQVPIAHPPCSLHPQCIHLWLCSTCKPPKCLTSKAFKQKSLLRLHHLVHKLSQDLPKFDPQQLNHQFLTQPSLHLWCHMSAAA